MAELAQLVLGELGAQGFAQSCVATVPQHRSAPSCWPTFPSIFELVAFDFSSIFELAAFDFSSIFELAAVDQDQTFAKGTLGTRRVAQECVASRSQQSPSLRTLRSLRNGWTAVL